VKIVADIKERGMDAVREWALELDGVEPARAVAEPELLPREELLTLADRVSRWHEAQRPRDVELEIEPGVGLERRWVPLRSVGVYVPRGLVSTLVMCAVPAQAAGVERIVVVTPPTGAGLVAAAAEALGIEEVWAIGGPQAIACGPPTAQTSSRPRASAAAATSPAPVGGVTTTIRSTPAACAGTAHMTSVDTRPRGT
jgi:histidinol dehydrogenase